MPIDYEFDAKPMRAGESRELKSLSPSVTVQIRCFTQKPPPPGFRPCPECGSFPLAQGDSVQVVAAPKVFGTSGGTLHIELTNPQGEKADIAIAVLKLENAAGASGVMTA